MQGVMFKENYVVKIGKKLFYFFFLENQRQVGLSNKNKTERDLLFVACTTKSNALEERTNLINEN
jgi:hypothetical protein